MRFTENEMVLLNSITPGKNIFGIPIRIHVSEDEKLDILCAKNHLAEKGLIENDDILSVQGYREARKFEIYKKSRAHVVINYMHLGFGEEEKIVCIFPWNNREYEVLDVSYSRVMLQLLKKYPILCMKGKNYGFAEEHQELDSFLKELGEYEGNILVGVFYENKIMDEFTYFWKEENLYRYDFHRNTRRQISAPQARRELLKVLREGIQHG